MGFFVARKQDLDDTVAIHPTSGEGMFRPYLYRTRC